jgi:DNA-binding transcriptional LysR family regulator
MIAEFRKLHPNVSIELITDSRLLNLARREADLAFRIKPFDEPNIIQRKLMHMNYALYGSLSLEIPVAGDGTGCSLITMDSAFADIPDAKWLRKLLPNATIGFASNSREAQAMQCIAGAGVTVLPCILAERMTGLKHLDLGEEPPGRDVFFGYHYDLRYLERLRKFILFVQGKLGAEVST